MKVVIPGPRDAVADVLSRSTSLSPASASSTTTLHRFILEGNIGAGKSYSLDQLQDDALIALKEPTHKWETAIAASGVPLFKSYYENPTKYAFEFQSYAMATHHEAIQESIAAKPAASTLLTERSGESAFHIFTKALREKGHLSADEFLALEATYRDTREVQPALSGVIYISTPPWKCLKRIQNRGRDGEASVAVAFLTTLHDLHTDWIQSLTVPVLTIAGDGTTAEMLRIKKFIGAHSTIV